MSQAHNFLFRVQKAIHGTHCYGRLVILTITILLTISPSAASAAAVNSINEDQPVSLRFYGARSADLLTREVKESFEGVLQHNFVPQAANGFPTGFVGASPHGQGWGNTMWTRDAGTYLREMVMRGYYRHAVLLAECFINLVDKNAEGFYSFPRYFRGTQHDSGTELDGTAAIVIGMVQLWERLPAGDPARDKIRDFLLQDASPVNYFRYSLRTKPLLVGTGEFGCGLRIPGACINVVQNNLAMLALTAVGNMAKESGQARLGDEYYDLAQKIRDGMEKFLVDKDGSWIWAIDPSTMEPNPDVLNAKVNRGFAGINGVASMYADVLGLEPLESSWNGIRHNEITFQRNYDVPLRKSQFERYGIWTQFDDLLNGLGTSPSYGQAYATQIMLLYDKMEMADKAISWFANATYKPVPDYPVHRSSRWYFCGSYYSPDAVGKVKLTGDCGELNLVNVTEPLKISRLMLGVDDTDLQNVKVIPRLPPSWSGMKADNWPILTNRGVVRANIKFKKKGTGAELILKLALGQQIDHLRVRMPSNGGFVWREQNNVKSVHFVTK